jgi:site-specific recombinase XerD
MTQYEGDPIEYYEDVWNEFCAWLLSEHDSQKTINRRRTGSKQYLNWCGEHDVDPRTAGQAVVENYLEDKSYLASNTRENAYTSVMVLYNWWIRGRDGITREHNPCADLDITDYTTSGSKYVRMLAREGKSDLKALSNTTVEALFPYAADEGARTELRNEALLRLAWDSAARCDELARMRVEKIDWDDRYISIRSSKLDPDQELFRRRVFFSPTTKRYLDLWVSGGRQSLSSTFADSEYL